MHQTAKIVLCGKSGVGKSSLLRRYTAGTFDSSFEQSTIGVEFGCRLHTSSSGQTFKLMIWDTAGQELYRSVAKSYFRNAAVALLVFDVNCFESFEELVLSWVPELLQQQQECPHWVLVGNKTDRDQRQVSRFQAERLAVNFSRCKECRLNACFQAIGRVDTPLPPPAKACKTCTQTNSLYFETSALYGTGIDTVFQACVDVVESTMRNERETPESETAPLLSTDHATGKACCST